MHINWWFASFTPRWYLTMSGQDTFSSYKENACFSPTLYSTSWIAKNYESCHVNSVDVEKNYGLRESLVLTSKSTFTWLVPPFETGQDLMHHRLVLKSLCSPEDGLEDVWSSCLHLLITGSANSSSFCGAEGLIWGLEEASMALCQLRHTLQPWNYLYTVAYLTIRTWYTL